MQSTVLRNYARKKDLDIQYSMQNLVKIELSSINWHVLSSMNHNHIIVNSMNQVASILK